MYIAFSVTTRWLTGIIKQSNYNIKKSLKLSSPCSIKIQLKQHQLKPLGQGSSRVVVTRCLKAIHDGARWASLWSVCQRGGATAEKASCTSLAGRTQRRKPKHKVCICTWVHQFRHSKVSWHGHQKHLATLTSA